MPAQPQKPMFNQVKVMPLSQQSQRVDLVKQDQWFFPIGRVDANSKP